jgi:hypothetical protein
VSSVRLVSCVLCPVCSFVFVLVWIAKFFLKKNFDRSSVFWKLKSQSSVKVLCFGLCRISRFEFWFRCIFVFELPQRFYLPGNLLRSGLGAKWHSDFLILWCDFVRIFFTNDNIYMTVDYCNERSLQIYILKVIY